jgi:glycosyltransferase involved in cell wall biosynthesis
VKLAYITNARIPSERANAMQTVHMCAAFASAGAQVTLYYPKRRNLTQFDNTDVYTYYGVPHNFELYPVPCIDWFHLTGGNNLLERFVFLAQTASFALSLLGILRRAQLDFYYARDALVLALLTFSLPAARKRMMFEIHSFPGSSLGQKLQRWMLTRIGGVVAITNALRERLLVLGISADRILVAPDGVNLSRYQSLTRETARAHLNLPASDKLAVYTGHLYAWKGAGVFAEAVAQVKELRGLLVGGRQDDVERMRRTVKENGWRNVEVVGHISPNEVPYYQVAADILVLPNSAQAEISRSYTSPLKLFEYMAAERPIIASDLPSLREVLNEDNAHHARRDVEAYSWRARAEQILKQTIA